MKITAITPQVKRQGRYSIYVDGAFVFGLGEAQVIAQGIRSGQEITEEKLRALKGESEFGKIYDRTLNLLSYRARSEHELRDYLRRKKQPPALIKKILNKLSKLGYVDDKAFAQRWVEHRRAIKPISSLKLRAELKQKRVANEVIDTVLGDRLSDAQALETLISRKSTRYTDRQKFMAYLARQGFRYDDIKQALAEFDENTKKQLWLR